MWDQRFTETPYFYGKMPNDFVVGSVSHIPKGRVLCLAEGEGRNSVFLARSGYVVSGVDFSEKAVENAKQLAKENGVEVDYRVGDLENYAIGECKWEGIVSIFCHLPLKVRKSIHQKVVKGLKPGGAFVLEAYSPDQLSMGTGGPKTPELLISIEDLKSELHGLDFELGHQTERIIFEGIGHNGPSSVTQLIGIKK